jgi:serine protease Do
MREVETYTTTRWPRVLVWGGMAAVAVVLAWHFGNGQAIRAQTLVPPAPVTPPLTGQFPEELQRAEGLSRAFRSATRQVLPAVVVIKAGSSPVCPRCGRAHDAEEDEGAAGNWGRQTSLDVLGSGFIVTPTGIVLTNKHVAEQETRLVVQTADGKQFPVVQVKTDPEHDVAVPKIDAPAKLPFVSLGDSDKAEIGDWVLTIGCPLELEQTVSAGIISAKNRSFCPRHPTRYLQTDAVVNPGSSGGPLVALNGTVIGITTSIASDDGGYQGIGFAIPASFVRPLLERVAETDTAVRIGGATQ